jgi:hypothetical protein
MSEYMYLKLEGVLEHAARLEVRAGMVESDGMNVGYE